MVLSRMETCGVTIHPNLILKQVSADAIELVSSFGGKSYRQEGFDSVVLVYGSVRTLTCMISSKPRAASANLHRGLGMAAALHGGGCTGTGPASGW